MFSCVQGKHLNNDFTDPSKISIFLNILPQRQDFFFYPYAFSEDIYLAALTKEK